MTVRFVATIQRWEGLSTDDKPSAEKEGSVFHEIDTGKKFILQNEAWVRDVSGPVSVMDFTVVEDAKRRLAEIQLIKPDPTLDEDGHYNFMEYR